MILKKRKLLISKEKEETTIIQIIGFGLIALGVLAIILGVLINSKCIDTPSVIAVSFFIIMLGFSFAFPTLLEGNDGLSTMRIVVFMVTNIICMLLLKIGWQSCVYSLSDIGLDANWVGVIAFVFGAKATQSFFESKLAVPENTKMGMSALNYTNAEIAKLAVSQNEQYLKVKFPNIVSISDAVQDLNNKDSHVVALYLKDNNITGIPSSLEVKMPGGSIKTIGTEIVKGVGVGKIQVNQESVVDTGVCKGSVCCIVDTNNGYNAIVTAGHVYSNDRSTDSGGELDISEQKAVKIDDATGKWIFQLINYKNDVALASIDTLNNSYVSFKGKEHYQITDKDVKNTQVKLISKMSGERPGYILDFFTTWDVVYKDTVQTKSNIILIGSTNNKDTCKTVSKPGDSGGCVYDEKSGNLIGLILGGNDSFTWVLPLQEVFEQFNYKLI